MVRKPPPRSRLLPGFLDDTSDADVAVMPRPEENHALQDDLARNVGGAVSGAARAAPGEQDAARHAEPLRGGPESQPRVVDAVPGTHQAGKRPAADQQRSAGAGDYGPP